ncbi:MAG: dihydropteroate synthase [Candidatus Poribacteria bacterium]|nr:dihydropteroate synthase [Candidatus Poribacteria bacterium]
MTLFTNNGWSCREETGIMGIINVTPDSFSDGGKYANVEAAVMRAKQMVADGADIIDIGGESSRPGAEPISANEECRRVVPVVQALAEQFQIPISVDTYKAEVAYEALSAGACVINDITALHGDPNMCQILADAQAGVILMHMQGVPATMQKAPTYQNVVVEVHAWLTEVASQAVDRGIDSSRIMIDPGIGFGKTLDHNLEILRHLMQFRGIGYPLLVGVSRKKFIGQILDLPVHQREEGTAATVAWSIINGANVVRVHDVAKMKQVAQVIDAICQTKPDSE